MRMSLRALPSLALAFVFFFVAVLPLPVYAQAAAVIADAAWYQPLIEPALTVVGLALAAAATWLFALLKSKWGIEIDEKYRKMLHDTLMNGMRRYLASKGWLPGQPVDETEALNFVAVDAQVYSPGSVKHFKLLDPRTPTDIKALASTYLPTVNPATAPTPDAVKPTPAGPVKTDAAASA